MADQTPAQDLDLTAEQSGGALYAKVADDPAPRPDITPAQLVGMIPLVAEFGHAFGLYTLSQPQQDSLSKLVLAGIGLFGADAIIRFGRNLAHRR